MSCKAAIEENFEFWSKVEFVPCEVLKLIQDSLLDSCFPVAPSGTWISDSQCYLAFGFPVLLGFQIPSCMWIPHCNHLRDFRFLELNSRFQSSGFQIPLEKISQIFKSTQKKPSWIPEPGFPHMLASTCYSRSIAPYGAIE